MRRILAVLTALVQLMARDFHPAIAALTMMAIIATNASKVTWVILSALLLLHNPAHPTPATPPELARQIRVGSPCARVIRIIKEIIANNVALGTRIILLALPIRANRGVNTTACAPQEFVDVSITGRVTRVTHVRQISPVRIVTVVLKATQEIIATASRYLLVTVG